MNNRLMTKEKKMNYKVPFFNSQQEKKHYEDLYLNSLEEELRKQSVDYILKLIDVYPVYCLSEQRFINYRRFPNRDHKHSIIREYIDSPTYRWEENAYCNTISLFHFMNIRKGCEWQVEDILSEDRNSFWLETFGVLEGGTIISPIETRKIIKLLQNTTVEPSFIIDKNEEEWNMEKAREYYHAHFVEGDFDEL